MAEGFIARAFGSAPGAHAADETNVDPSERASLPEEAAAGAAAANDDGAGKPVVPEQLKLDLQRVVRTTDEAGNVLEPKTGSAARREREETYVSIAEVGGSLKNNEQHHTSHKNCSE